MGKYFSFLFWNGGGTPGSDLGFDGIKHRLVSKPPKTIFQLTQEGDLIRMTELI